MWTLLFLCCVLTTHGVQVAGWFDTTFVTDEPTETTLELTSASQDTDEPCGGYLYGNNGTFSSPYYPHYYLDNQDCLWFIRTDGNIVELNFTHVDIEFESNCIWDAIYVYDGPNTGSRFLGMICGTQTPTFYSTTAYLTVRFRTDGVISYSGFEASYKAMDFVQRSCRDNCGNHMGSCSCIYPCQDNGDCCHDYSWECSYYTTEATETMTSTSIPTTLQESTGTGWFTSVITETVVTSAAETTTTQSASTGWFHSSMATEAEETTAEETSAAETMTSPSTRKPCGGYLFGFGKFSSPNHPDHYDNRSYCVWQLRAAHDQRIYITFNFVELENCCSCDYISVYDGPSVNSGLLGRVCNSSVASFFSTHQYITVVFRSNSAVVARGFKAEFMSTLQSSSGRVECSSDNMNIFISRSYLNSLGYNGSDLYLNDPNCRPYYNSNYEVVFNYSISSCGNVKKIDNGTVTYTNNVNAYNSSSSSSSSEITRQSQFELIVNCRMEKDSVSQIMYIANQTGSNSIIGSGRFNTSMDFYTSSSFNYKVTQRPYTVSLNEYMYVQVNLRNPDGDLVIFIDTCVTSPSADDFSSRPYYLVRDGCRADSTYETYVSGTRSYARFRFKSFRFLRASKSVYIQCTVLICPDSDNNSRCRRNTCTRRTARDLGSYHDSQTLVLGPIQLKEPEKKEEGSDEQSKA